MKGLELKEELEKNDDESCKKILSNKSLLSNILKSCTSEFKDVVIQEISKYIEKDINDLNTIIGLNTGDIKISGAKIQYDLLFDAAFPNSDDRIGLIINIEARNKDDPSYPLIASAIYHTSSLIAGQKNNPIGFKKSEFQNIKKVYSIWICVEHSVNKDDCFNKYFI